jgi:hypothetical protein
MRDKRERMLKLGCLVLGAILAAQLIRFMLAGDPAKGLVIPVLPTLPPELAAQGGATNSTGGKGTNTPANPTSKTTGTNTAPLAGQTNVVTPVDARQSTGTNPLSAKPSETNAVVTNLPSGSNTAGTTTANVKPEASAATNLTANSSSNVVLTNFSATPGSGERGTNATNIVAGKTGTNATAVSSSAKTNALPPGSSPGRMAMGGKPPELPAEIKERVDRIIQGEILGQVMRPMPMALLGIAGPNAFLRSPEGQMGMIKEGEKLGSLKLLRIGNNRVLVEEDGEKKELSIFAGLGSETLMPAKEPSAKDKKPNEPTKSQ